MPKTGDGPRVIFGPVTGSHGAVAAIFEGPAVTIAGTGAGSDLAKAVGLQAWPWGAFSFGLSGLRFSETGAGPAAQAVAADWLVKKCSRCLGSCG